jgi:D-alanyl-D-alanine carboxypeptidase/D-alanyl-D-alanine-endopeptidase (penicillin-binding protein 4)
MRGTMPARIRRLSLAAPLLAMGLLLSGLPAVAAAPVPGTATLAVSKQVIVYGGHITLTGAVTSSDAGCEGARPVNLQGREPGQASWFVLKGKNTNQDGTYVFAYRQPAHTSWYRVVLPPRSTSGVTCAATRSGLAHNTVRARVRVGISPNPVDAGACATLAAVVLPSKAGTTVRFRRRGPSGWRTVGTKTLGASSKASLSRCYRWNDIGSVGVQAVWPAQDKLNAMGADPATVRVAKAPWMRKINSLAGGRNVSVAVANGGRFLFERADGVAHAPASNEKLLQSMALLQALGSADRIRTTAAAAHRSGRRVRGALWLIGRGDPSVGRKDIAALANRIVAAGIHRVGRIMGSRNYFSHDWFARGWKSFFPAEEVALPSALTYRGNQVHGVHVRDPERRAAVALSKALKRRGVKVARAAGSGTPPGGLHRVARIASPRLRGLLAAQNFDSVNFYAEVLGKLLGAVRYGSPGTIAKGAAAIRAFAAAHGVRVRAYDSSGLSYRDRITPAGMVRMLRVAERAPWGPALVATLPRPGFGTLEDRLARVPVRAKTGTLESISALSGWVLLDRTGRWARFSILSSGFAAWRAKNIEDAIVRTLWHYGR